MRVWEETLRVLERNFEERVSAKMRTVILTNMVLPNLQD